MESSKRNAFQELTWADLQEWAGDTIVSRGRSYQQRRRVEELAYVPSGGIVAWVQGSEQYATSVDIEGKRLISACTCPYEDTCKHAVAVVFQYLECLKQDIELPTVTQDDERLVLLEETVDRDASCQEDEGWNTDRGMKQECSFDSGNAPDVLDSFLKQQTKAQLRALLEDISERYPAVCRYLQDRHDVVTESTGSAALLIKTVRKEIYSISSKPGWYRKWEGEGYTPDYSHVRDCLEALLARGHADEVVKLGEILFKKGTAQVEMSDDEGETAAEISSCMSVVFRALSKSSLSPARQLLWAVEADLEDCILFMPRLKKPSLYSGL